MKIDPLSAAVLGATLMLLAPPPAAATPHQCPKDVALTRLVAASDLVLTGIPQTSADAVTAEEVGRLAMGGLSEIPSDLQGSADYRSRVGAAMVARAWAAAAREATTSGAEAVHA